MDPLGEYTTHRDKFRVEEQVLERQFNRIGNWRLVVGLSGAVLAWFVFARRSLGLWWLTIPLIVFLVLAILHQRVLRRRTLANRAIAFYDRGIARLRDEWIGKGNLGERFRDTSHVYSEDLDLFGAGSLFDLIAIARTAAGEDTLASWLLHPASLEEGMLRQTAVNELRPNLKLREDFALLAQEVRADVRVAALGNWGAAPIVKFPAMFRPLAIVLAILGVIGVIAFFAGLIPLWPLVAVLGCDFAIVFTLRRRVIEILENVEASGRDLKVFAALVACLEHEKFESPRLRQLCAALAVTGKPASKRIARLSRLTDWLDSGDHVIVRVFRPLLLYREQLAFAFEKWRSSSGSHIGSWLHAVAEFEALSSLACLAFERTDWQMPRLLERSEARFAAQGIRHPLLSRTICVANDLVLNRGQRLMVVSGSNMSGKSTLLRAVGLNAVLAWAGAPVAANSLETAAVQIGASIRITDSLQDHRSRFLAEITRLRQIIDLTKSGQPVLFLLDELLSGTNSHDRRIGAAGIVRELLHANTIGLITTHDLALANIEQDISAGVVNVHFEDHMNGSEMLFDYKLKPGVVTRSNAIALMRAVGLDV
jgi:hypothetical protein